MPWGTAGQTQILRMVERGGGPNARGRPGSRPRAPSADRRADWWPCPGMAWAGFCDDTLVSRSLARVAGTPASIPTQQSPAVRIGDCSELSCWHSFVAASGPHQALHKTLASGPAARVRTVRKTEARNIQRCRQLKIARTTPTDAWITVQLTTGVMTHFHTRRWSPAKFFYRAAENTPALAPRSLHRRVIVIWPLVKDPVHEFDPL